MRDLERTKLYLFGPFRLVSPAGVRVEVSSRKGVALIALLALSPGGERSRGWLKDRLWGSRERLQAQNSLRREISQLRALFAANDIDILQTPGDRVSVDLARLELVAGTAGQELLEGLDIPGEEVFEEWLREQRQIARPSARLPAAPVVPLAPLRTASIAILPFANLTGDPDKTYLADGIADELADRVSRLRWLPVISPGQSFKADGEESYLDAGRRLNAAYVLGGKLRQHDDGYWLSAQIIECATGQLIWSPRLRLSAPQASNAVVPMVEELVGALEHRIDNAEKVRAKAVPEIDLSVNDLIWRGRWHQDRVSHEDTAIAGRYFAEAMRLAPGSALAVIEYTRHFGYEIWNKRLPDDSIREMRDLAQKAILLDYEDARGHMFAGMAEMWLRQTGRAEVLFKRAIGLNPSLTIAHEQLGTLKILSGHPAEGIFPLEFAIKLSPTDYRLFLKHGELALAHLMMGEHDRALDHAEQSITLRPAYWHAHVSRINALARRGQNEQARAALAELMTVRPHFTPDYIDWVPFVDPQWHAFLKAGLAMAGSG
jgi:TolB-like protein